MVREYRSWFSMSLGRTMELLVFGDAGLPLIVFPTREGRFYDYENWGQVAALHDLIVAGRLRLFCVDSVDTEALYARQRPARERLERCVRYERYILDEVIPLARWGAPDALVALHGCSIGAYHALTIGLRHPDCVRGIVALSGRYDLTTAVGPFADLFDGYYDADVYFHTPSHFVPNVTDPSLLNQFRRLAITMAVGEQDPFMPNARALSGALAGHGVAHRFDLWPGEAHRARDWCRMTPLYVGRLVDAAPFTCAR